MEVSAFGLSKSQGIESKTVLEDGGRRTEKQTAE